MGLVNHLKEKMRERAMEKVWWEPESLRYMWQTPDLCMAAVRHNPNSLPYVREQTPEICMEAVSRIGTTLKHVREQTPEICMTAVRKDWHALSYVREQTPEICMEAVRNNGYALQHVREKTDDICAAAVKANIRALEYAPAQFRTPQLEKAYEKAIRQDENEDDGKSLLRYYHRM